MPVIDYRLIYVCLQFNRYYISIYLLGTQRPCDEFTCKCRAFTIPSQFIMITVDLKYFYYPYNYCFVEPSYDDGILNKVIDNIIYTPSTCSARFKTHYAQ